jgi:hypothetical protein
MTTTQYEHKPLVTATLIATVMICNTAIRIANAWIQHSVQKHNASAGAGATEFLKWPDAIEQVEVP